MEEQSLIEQIKAANTLTIRLGTILRLDALVHELASITRTLALSERSVILVADEENATLSIAAVAAAEPISLNLTFSIYDRRATGISAWYKGEAFSAASGQLTPDSVLYEVAQKLGMGSFGSVPLRVAETLVGVIMVDNPTTHQPINERGQQMLDAVKDTAAILVANARLHSKVLTDRDARVRELEIMRQIDRELSDTIRLDRVFDLTLDWAMRYTLAQGASLALFDDIEDELRFVADLGYSITPEQLVLLRANHGGGITQRVARSGHPELIPDVSLDTDYVTVSNTIQAHMSIPVMREDRVIAVITLESRRLNAFTDEHLDFVAKLAARAGVAIDNARLYAEAVREREKLSHILSEIADVVLVIGLDNRVMMINQQAIAALQLYADQAYEGRPFAEVLDDTPLLSVIQRAQATGHPMMEEVELAGDRTYYAEFSPQPEIGWIIVMHDITPLKQTDELKRELVATVSHDLKQPLSVMNGYLELLQMSQRFDTRGDNFVHIIMRSIEQMRHLIDDVLDLAKIEAGIAITVQPVKVDELINECLDAIKPFAESKAMHLETEFTNGLPLLAGDPERLLQIFNNLVGNAVKYTQPEGTVTFAVEQLEHNLRFMVKDNGIGISPEEQAHIFDRFYRVRRPETENIEGTGLGLAIVKKLIEAHNGQIGLESSLGEGTTFYVTLPIYQVPDTTEPVATL